MRWPISFPARMSLGATSLAAYRSDDATELHVALAHPRVWEHMSRPTPPGVAALNEVISSKLSSDGHCVTFTVRDHGRVVGVTSVQLDSDDPGGAEIGGTLLDPTTWGTGVNPRTKRLLLDVLFDHGAAWVQLRTDERNHRSAAAIRKLGVVELGTREEAHRRQDGTSRTSVVFRVERSTRVSRLSGQP